MPEPINESPSLEKVDDQFPPLQPGPRRLAPTGVNEPAVSDVSRVTNFGTQPAPVPVHEEERKRQEQLRDAQTQAAALNEGADADSDAEESFGKLQKRIHRLYGQWKTAEEGKSDAEQRLVSLEEKYEALRQQYVSRVPPVTQTPAPAQPSSSFMDMSNLATPAVTPQTPSAPPSQDDVVLNEIRNLQARLDRREQLDLLSAQQDGAWQEAVTEHPELTEKRSMLRAAAAHIFQSDPNMRQDPRGPLKAVIMAKGLLADTARNEARLESRRRAAGTAVHSALGTEGNNRAQLKQEYDAILDKMARGIGDTNALWKRSRQLQRMLNAPQ